VRPEIWAVIAGAIAVIVGLRKRAQKSLQSLYSVGEYSGADVANTARMLIAETGFRRSKREQAGIVWVAIHRAKKAGAGTLRAGALTRVTYRPGIPNWNASGKYQELFDAADRARRFPAAKKFVRDILDGKIYPNEIGSRTMFLHPGGMPSCSSGQVGKAMGSKVCVMTTAGPRVLPRWSSSSHANVKVIDGARFS